MDISHGASWNKVAQQQQQQQQQQHISNDSSLGGDEFYDAMEDMSSRPQRISGISSGYGSNRSARTRSSSASNLVPTAEAAELMKLVASTNSSVKLDVSAFATPAEYAEAGASSGGYWLGGGGADGSHGENRSNNPFSEDAAAAAAAAAETRRRWPLSGHQQPAKLVVDDISSAENTPSTTPVHTPSGGGGIGGGGISASTLPAPPQPPPRPGKASGSSSNNTSATTLNPFAKESHSPKGRQGPTSTNPFVTASSTLNPFADDCPPQQEQGSEGGGSRSTGQPHDEGEGEAPPRAGELAAAATSAGDGGGGSSSAVKPAATAAPSADCNNQKKPPPLPPRRAASPSPAHQQGPPSAAPRSRTTTAGGEGSSGPTSPRSTVSSTTCDSGGGGGQLEGSGGGLDAGSVGSSAGSDGTADRKARKKYMVVNKDTGQKFDVRELDNHLPADNYALLPSRNDLIELERRRSATSTGSGPATPTPTTPATTLGKGKGSSAVAARSGSPSPRSALPTAVAASMPAAVGSTSSRREKAKTLGSMVRRKLGKVKTAAGAAAAAATAASPSSPSRPSSSGLGGGDTAVGEGGEGGGGGGGGSGDRGSIGGMGAAAKAAREALAGIRVSLKGKEASETLAGLMLFQELRCHDGPIWTAAFNQSGQFLATAGQDARILLHRVGDVRGDLEEDGGGGAGGEGANGGGAAAAAPQSPGAGPNRSGNNPGPASAGKVPNSGDTDEGKGSSATTTPEDGAAADGGGERPVSVSGGGAGEDGSAGVGSGGVGRDSGRRAAATVMIDPNPWQIWEAHKGDVVALSWSRNDFLLSASLDKSVRLWHTTQRNCLHCFHHAETVTSVDFHPLLEHFFLSGCFDKKIRVWNIRDGRVQEWQQAPDLVTAAKFSLDGQMIVAGLYMGQVLFYQTEGMRYFTQIECRNRRGTKKRGCKVSGFAFKRTHYGGKDAVGGDLGREGGGGVNGRSAASSPGGGRLSESPVTPVFGGSMARAGAGGVGGGGGGAGSHIPEQLLVTTNDSRLRLYNTDDFGMNAKYKGFTNDTLQITATFSEDGKQIICGSENGKVYVWNTGVFATASPSTLPVSGSVAQQQAAAAAAAGAGGANPAAPPAVAPTQKDTNQRHESFHATSEAPKIVTTACFVPESTSRACVTAVRGGLSRAVAESGGYCGCMILATDYNGSVRVYCKSAVLLS